jgi:hypothetical protein
MDNTMKILIYDSGTTYGIDESEIYVPFPEDK